MQSLDNLTDEERRQIYEEEERKGAERRRHRRRRPELIWLGVIAFLVFLFGMLASIAQAGGTPGDFLDRNDAEAVRAGRVPTAPPSFLPTPRPTPSTGIRTSFGDGVWLIGEQIAPGTYRASSPSAGCYWARFAASSDLNRLNARSSAATDAGAWSGGLTPQVEVAWIRDTDAAFETIGCGIWRRLAE